MIIISIVIDEYFTVFIDLFIKKYEEYSINSFLIYFKKLKNYIHIIHNYIFYIHISLIFFFDKLILYLISLKYIFKRILIYIVDYFFQEDEDGE